MTGNILDGIDDLITEYIKSVRNEDGKSYAYEGRKVPVDGELVVYFKNYTTYYRAQIIMVKNAIDTPEPVTRGILPKNVAEGIDTVFLTKNGKRDVEKSLKSWDVDPGDYITPATGGNDTNVNNMKQGIVYCTRFAVTTRKNYFSFHGKKEMERKDKIVSPENEASLVECRCVDCENVVNVPFVNSFKCGVGVFDRYKPAKEITNTIWCSKDKFKKKRACS